MPISDKDKKREQMRRWYGRRLACLRSSMGGVGSGVPGDPWGG